MVKEGKQQEYGTEENSPETEQTPFEVELNVKGRGGVVTKARGYCQFVGGKLLCSIGRHDLEETGSQKIHGSEYVYFKCKRSCGVGKIWMEYEITPDGERKRIL